MPVFLVWLGSLITSRVGFWLVSALMFAGISFGTQEVVIEPVLDLAIQSWGSLPSSIAVALAFVNVDKAITIIFSAIATRATLSGARAIFKKGTPT